MSALTYWTGGCVREMPPGQVKRVPQSGGLIGYQISCPGCGFVASYLDDDAGFDEAAVTAGRAWPVRLVGIGVPPSCFKCKRRIVVTGTQIEVA